MHINSFPAVHIKRMDLWDFSLKFSSELLVIALAILTALLNLSYFTGSSRHTYKDSSFVAQYLDHHQSGNYLLAQKNSSIITTVTPMGLIAQAQAEDFVGLDASQTPDNSSVTDSGVILNDDGMVKPNPDSIQSLIEKQVKIYETQAGDTLNSVAAANKISTQSLRWANNLPTDTLKPGWFLIIPPVNGIVAKADSNTTLPDLAAKYSPERYNSNKTVRDAAASSLLDTIISYNGLADAQDIDTGQIVIIPGGVNASPPAPPKPKVTPKSPTSKLKPGQQYIPPQDTDTSGHLFPWGYCTWYVANVMHDKGYDIPWGGNAKNWLANAKAYGAVVSKQPAPGVIVVTNDSARYGHVAIVSEVTDDSIIISEMNYKGKGIVDKREIPLSSSSIKGYIYH